MLLKFFKEFRGLIYNKYIEFLGEFEAICEMALAHESGP
jgi:hypothetical protein